MPVAPIHRHSLMSRTRRSPCQNRCQSHQPQYSCTIPERLPANPVHPCFDSMTRATPREIRFAGSTPELSHSVIRPVASRDTRRPRHSLRVPRSSMKNWWKLDANVRQSAGLREILLFLPAGRQTGVLQWPCPESMGLYNCKEEKHSICRWSCIFPRIRRPRTLASIGVKICTLWAGLDRK